MSNEVYLSDNAGHKVPPAGAPDPIAASGQYFSVDKDADTEATVVGGASYAFTAMLSGGFYFGVADVTVAANVIWACPLRETIIINIPLGITTLHYAGDSNNAKGRFRRLTD